MLVVIIMKSFLGDQNDYYYYVFIQCVRDPPLTVTSKTQSLEWVSFPLHPSLLVRGITMAEERAMHVSYRSDSTHKQLHGFEKVNDAHPQL